MKLVFFHLYEKYKRAARQVENAEPIVKFAQSLPVECIFFQTVEIMLKLCFFSSLGSSNGCNIGGVCTPNTHNRRFFFLFWGDVNQNS